MAYIGKVPTAAPLTASDITDGIISNAKLAQDIISADTALGATPADTDEFLVSDAGTLKRMDYSYIKGGITEADQWRLTTTFTGGADPIASNLERVDTTGFDKLGTGMSESSGIFTFPSTGIWIVRYSLETYYTGENRYGSAKILVTTNNSSYAVIAKNDQGIAVSSGTNVYANSITETLIDCTDTSNVKVKFSVANEDGSTSNMGDTDTTYTGMMFIRLGDT